MPKENLEEWIGSHAFGLGCEIAQILRSYGIEGNDCAILLMRIFSAIRNWHEVKMMPMIKDDAVLEELKRKVKGCTFE